MKKYSIKILLLSMLLCAAWGSTANAAPVITADKMVEGAKYTTDDEKCDLIPEKEITRIDPSQCGLQLTSVENAHKWGAENYTAWLKGLSKKESETIASYTVCSEIINGYLLGDVEGWSKSFSQMVSSSIEQIQTALTRAKVPENLVVYKGVRDRRIMEELVPFLQESDYSSIIGKEFINKSFMSTSVVKKAALIGATEFTWIINVPKNAEGAYIAECSLCPQEAELLLNAGQKLKVRDIIRKSASDIELVLDLILEEK